ncbi:MAG: hypothetical protein Q7O66_14025 [Dehalococcoidia bacterium]|nr:hypothetical protein [Dehalococcoidia bacterium]
MERLALATLIAALVLISHTGMTECPPRPVAIEAEAASQPTPQVVVNGTPCWWVRYTGTLTYFDHRGDAIRDDWSGWDGKVVCGPSEGGRVYFTEPCRNDCERPVVTNDVELSVNTISAYRPPERRFFKIEDLVVDPRLSSWWRETSYSGATIWQAVATAACSDERPDITAHIVAQIMAFGDRATGGGHMGTYAKRMSQERLRWLMKAYTLEGKRNEVHQRWIGASKQAFWSLWTSVQNGLGTRNTPGMTQAVIREMYYHEVLTSGQAYGTKPMTAKEIEKAMLAFAPTIADSSYHFW